MVRLNLTKEKLIEVIKMLQAGSLSSKNLKDLWTDLLETNTSIQQLIEEKGIQNISDDQVILDIIQKIIAANPASVKDYKEGKDRALKFLMGQVMKETKGSINPKKANDILIEQLKLM